MSPGDRSRRTELEPLRTRQILGCGGDGGDAGGMQSETARRWFPVLIFLFSFVAFFPSLRGEFLRFDDDYNYLIPTGYHGLGWANLRWMFFSFQLGGIWQPLSWMTNAVDYLIWGMNPMGYHLGNMLIHAGNAVLVYFLAIRLLNLAMPRPKGEADPPVLASAAFAALFYSLHPLRVEVVAWASNRSYALPTFFYLLAILAYLETRAPVRGEPRPRFWLGVSIAAFILSLASKSIGMTLPAVLLILDFYPLRRWGEEKGWVGSAAWAVWLEKIPFFILSILAAHIANRGHIAYGEVVPLSAVGLEPRLGQAFFGSLFYIEKTLVPLRLDPLYSMPISLRPLDKLCEFRTISFFAITGLAFFNRRRWPAGLALWSAYLIMVLPFLGLSQYGLRLQIASDKWCYIAAVPLSVLAGAGLLHCWRRFESGLIGKEAFDQIKGWVGATLLILGCLSWRQTLVWRDSETLFRHILSLEPDCYFCHGNLAIVMNERHDYNAGVAEGQAALRIRPDYFLAHLGLSVSYNALGRLDDAIAECKEALRQSPHDLNADEAHFNLGYYYGLKGDADAAIQETQAALQIRPNMTKARFNLGYMLQTKGSLDAAAEQYREVLRANPNADNAHFNLGIILTSQGKLDEAAYHCGEAHRLNPAHDTPLCRRKD